MVRAGAGLLAGRVHVQRSTLCPCRLASLTLLPCRRPSNLHPPSGVSPTTAPASPTPSTRSCWACCSASERRGGAAGHGGGGAGSSRACHSRPARSRKTAMKAMRSCLTLSHPTPHPTPAPGGPWWATTRPPILRRRRRTLRWRGRQAWSWRSWVGACLPGWGGSGGWRWMGQAAPLLPSPQRKGCAWPGPYPAWPPATHPPPPLPPRLLHLRLGLPAQPDLLHPDARRRHPWHAAGARVRYVCCSQQTPTTCAAPACSPAWLAASPPHRHRLILFSSDLQVCL